MSVLDNWYRRHLEQAYIRYAVIKSPKETLDVVERAIREGYTGAYLRFGDGDVNLLRNKRDMLQRPHSRLASEMREAFTLRGEAVYKAIPLHCQRFGLEQGMSPGVHENTDEGARRLLRHTFEYFVGCPIYSPIALSHEIVNDRDRALRFLKCLKNQRPHFVGNENIPAHVTAGLFGSTGGVKTPCRDAFAHIDRIEHEALIALDRDTREFVVVVVAMGCSGRVFAKRMLTARPERRIFIFDFGSTMDALCGWITRAWIELTGLGTEYYRQVLSDVASAE